MKYVSSEDNKHEYDEEFDWAKILESGPVAHGMLLIFVQKLCTAFHEYGPLDHQGTFEADDWSFISDRLAKRIDKVIEVAEDNGLGFLKGIGELKGVLETVGNLDDFPDLMELAEEVHQINHHICDELKIIEFSV